MVRGAQLWCGHNAFVLPVSVPLPLSLQMMTTMTRTMPLCEDELCNRNGAEDTPSIVALPLYMSLFSVEQVSYHSG